MYLTELNHCIESYNYRLSDYYGMSTYEYAISCYPFAYFINSERILLIKVM